MANRKGLGTSKKYANGTIHETATGKFMVLDRYAEEDDEKNIPMLEYQWISGDKEGKVEQNREMNMAASIHKFATAKGKPTIVAEPQRIEHNVPFMEMIEATYAKVVSNQNAVDTALDRLDWMMKTMNEQQKTIATLTEQLVKLNDSNALLLKQQATMDKLIEKM